MTELMDILTRIMGIAERVQGLEHLSGAVMAGLGVVLVFGILNCIFGYRLLRFWMMLGGFGVGAALGLFGAYTLEVQEKMIYGAAMLLGGILFAVIAFLIYKAGIFILAAGIGWTLSIYLIHPTSSAVFFGCILLGVALGSLAVKFCREVLIVSTSLIGGLMAGMALARLGNLAEFPYGAGMSVGFALLGILIQFAINRSEEDEDEEEDETDETEDSCIDLSEALEKRLPEETRTREVHSKEQRSKRTERK